MRATQLPAFTEHVMLVTMSVADFSVVSKLLTAQKADS